MIKADCNEQLVQFCNPLHLFGSVRLLISKVFADLYNYSGLIVYLELKSINGDRRECYIAANIGPRGMIFNSN